MHKNSSTLQNSTHKIIQKRSLAELMALVKAPPESSKNKATKA